MKTNIPSIENYFRTPVRTTGHISYDDSQKKNIRKILLDKKLSHNEIWDGDCSSSGVLISERDGIKKHIKTKLEELQGKFCCYCGFDYQLRNGKKGSKSFQREHIAPKHSHREHIFTEKNLALACAKCNFDYKGKKETIIRKIGSYSLYEFLIVHPYLDEWYKHIELDSSTGILKALTVKGYRTITLFGLNERGFKK